MVQSKIQKFFILMKRNFRYIFVFILLVSVYLFGGNYELKKDQILTKKNKLAERNIYNMFSSDEYIEAKDQISTKQDTYYRLSFDVKALPDLNKLRLENNSSLEDSDKIIINVSLREVLGDKKQIGQITISTNNRLVSEDIIFVADGNYRDIIFQRFDKKEKNQINYSNIRLSPINCNSVQCIGKIIPTINGKNQKFIQSFHSGEVLKGSAKFYWNNQLIGRIIQPDSDQIESVDMAINKIGSGGLGSYQIVLFKIGPVGGNMQIEASPTSTFHFFADDLADYQVGDNLYRFPLTAKLQRGEKYFLAISDIGAEFNSLNNLNILLSDGDYLENEIISSSIFRLTNKNIYLVVNSIDYVSGFDGKLLINSKIEDLGNGQGLYSYHFSHSSADFLDIDHILGQGISGSVFRDSVSDGISISTSSDSGVIYKFDTIYPFDRFFIKIAQLSGKFSSGLIYYSYDLSGWEQISFLKDDQNKFEKTLVGNGTNHQVYLKMIPNPADNNKAVKLFNIQSIDISAKLGL